MLSLPALPSDKDQSLTVALSPLLAEYEASHPHVTAVRRLEAVAAQYAPFPEAMDPRLARALRTRGIEQLYTHQAEAIAHALAGRNVVIVTPTASGKTLCYNAPVLRRDPRATRRRARCICFRRRRSRRISSPSCISWPSSSGGEGGGDIGVFTYDGDTPQDARRAIRGARARRAEQSRTWCTRASCRTIRAGRSCSRICNSSSSTSCTPIAACSAAISANIVRRLQRVCRHYGSRSDVHLLVGDDRESARAGRAAGRARRSSWSTRAARRAARSSFCSSIRRSSTRSSGIRRSYLAETRRVAIEFLKRGLQVDRLRAEPAVDRDPDDVHEGRVCRARRARADVIRGYRGGYLPLRRREIERGLRSGDVRCVVSTNALELGIDIGALDVAVMAGYPGTIAATWQRAGRAGRRSGRSAAVLVASSAPIDQFVVRNPEYFFGASPEHALVNPDNLHILLDHVKCAAFELPFTADESSARSTCRRSSSVLAEEGFVHFVDGQWQWTQESYPADAVSLRSVTSDNFVVVDTTDGERVIGETDFTSGPVDAAREGDLHRRRPALPGRAIRLRRAQGVRARGRVRLLHGRDHVHEGHDPGDVLGSGDSGTGPRALRQPDSTTARVEPTCPEPSAASLAASVPVPARTARSTSSPASSDSRRSSSTRTRTSDRASWICPSSRCTRRRTG